MTDLQSIIEWIDTMADRRELDDQTREVASVIARRHTNQCSEGHLPKTTARKAISIAQRDSYEEREDFMWCEE